LGFGDITAPTCIDSNPDSISTECAISYEEGIESRGTFQRTNEKEGSADIDFYDPADAICEEGQCYSMVGQLITRYDEGHLSEELAKSYAPDFTRFMHEDVLGSRQSPKVLLRLLRVTIPMCVISILLHC